MKRFLVVPFLPFFIFIFFIFHLQSDTLYSPTPGASMDAPDAPRSTPLVASDLSMNVNTICRETKEYFTFVESYVFAFFDVVLIFPLKLRMIKQKINYFEQRPDVLSSLFILEVCLSESLSVVMSV